MKKIKQVLMIFTLVFMAFSQSLYADSDGKKLFVNITSDDINRAAMAIGFSTKIRMEKKIPVTIFLNVEGVRIADKNIPGHKHSTGKTLKEMLAGFMQAGWQSACLPYVYEECRWFKQR